MASTYLQRTGIGTSNNRKKWTFSVWLKRCLSGSEQRIITSSDNSSYDDNIRFESTDQLRIKFNNGTSILTNRKFRDTFGWYHIVVKADTAQASANDRLVLYVNGVDERTVGGYATDTMPSQDSNGYINYAQHYIGVTNPTANSNHFNGVMSHIHFTEGYAYTASSFGSTDSTTGEWKINTGPSVSYGTTGFFILKDGNSVTDSSPNSNNFTVAAGTLSKTEDNPSNVFCTLNELTYAGSQFTLRYGNNSTYGVTSDAWRYLTGTLAANSGKFYWEVKYDTYYAGDPDNVVAGIMDIAQANTSTGGDAANGKYFGLSRGYGLDFRDGKIINGTSTRGNGTTYSADLAPGDILGVAMDLDNNKLYFAKNGTWQYSSNPENGTNPAFTFASGYTYAPVFSSYYNTEELTFNFGNGYFGTTQISSAGTNASNNGIFEYDVPAGYTALSTKGLNL